MAVTFFSFISFPSRSGNFGSDHEEGHFFHGTAPIFRRKTIEGQNLYAFRLSAVLISVLIISRLAAWPRTRWQPLFLGPAPIAVHDHCHMGGSGCFSISSLRLSVSLSIGTLHFLCQLFRSVKWLLQKPQKVRKRAVTCRLQPLSPFYSSIIAPLGQASMQVPHSVQVS